MTTKAASLPAQLLSVLGAVFCRSLQFVIKMMMMMNSNSNSNSADNF